MRTTTARDDRAQDVARPRLPAARTTGVHIPLAHESFARLSVGGAAVARRHADAACGFTSVDAAARTDRPGHLTSFAYYGQNAVGLPQRELPFRFVVLDPGASRGVSSATNRVRWVGEPVVPAEGPATWTPPEPVPVQAGDVVAVHFESAGSIPFDVVEPATIDLRDPAWVRTTGAATPAWTGTPVVGGTLPLAFVQWRAYSYNATLEA